MPPASRRRIVLASGSPRRREIAVAEGWDVAVVPPPESVEAGVSPRAIGEDLAAYCLRLARAKGRAVAETVPRGAPAYGMVLACDTLSEIDGEALGKPTDRADARRMLTLLSGRQHRVLTGVWLCRRGQDAGIADRTLEAVEESLLVMHPLEPALLDWYLDSGLWQGKAGGCGFQDERLPLHLVSGSASNVVGLPIERVRAMLEAIDALGPAH